MSEDRAAQRTRDEAHRKGPESRQRAHERIDVREEQPAEDERGGRAVEEESYHSIAVPMKLATITGRIEGGVVAAAAGVWVVVTARLYL